MLSIKASTASARSFLASITGEARPLSGEEGDALDHFIPVLGRVLTRKTQEASSTPREPRESGRFAAAPADVHGGAGLRLMKARRGNRKETASLGARAILADPGAPYLYRSVITDRPALK